jgi:hypothetical protein
MGGRLSPFDAAITAVGLTPTPQRDCIYCLWILKFAFVPHA